MSQAEHGDKVAWVQDLLARFEGPLLRYTVRLNGGDLEQARDVVQETFLKLCAQEPGALAGHEAQWLYTVCRHRVFELRRRDRRRPEAGGEVLAQLPAAEASPATACEQRDDRQRVRDLVAALPERQRELLDLRFQAGLSYEAMARLTGLSVTNVGFILHTAVRALRQRWRADSAIAASGGGGPEPEPGPDRPGGCG